jgi:hypothetical protein
VFAGQVPRFTASLPELMPPHEITTAEDEAFFDELPRCRGYLTVEFRVPPPPTAAATKAAAVGKLDGDYRREKTIAETFSMSSGCAGGYTREILVPLTRALRVVTWRLFEKGYKSLLFWAADGTFQFQKKDAIGYGTETTLAVKGFILPFAEVYTARYAEK